MNAIEAVRNELENIEAVSGCSDEEYLSLVEKTGKSNVERVMTIIDSDGERWHLRKISDGIYEID